MLEDKLSEDILRGRFKTGDTITADAKDGELIIRAAKVAVTAGKEKTA